MKKKAGRKPQRKPYTEAARAWLATARKGETFEYFRGDISRILMSPEECMTNAQRRAHSQVCERIRKDNKRTGAKTRPPPIPDRYERERPDVVELMEDVDRAEVRGLIELSVVAIDKETRIYIMTCTVQRNGLRAVREREHT